MCVCVCVSERGGSNLVCMFQMMHVIYVLRGKIKVNTTLIGFLSFADMTDILENFNLARVSSCNLAGC